jgi:TatA/E family protein of Tat protein translocase
MFGTLGGPELFLIFVVALIIFGPRKLPEIGKSLGRMMGEFRKASNEFRSTIENEVEAEKIRDAMRIEPPRPASAVSPPVAPSTPAGDEATGGTGSPQAPPVEPTVPPAGPRPNPTPSPDPLEPK